MSVETGRITTDIPARLDRLPWSRFHWLVEEASASEDITKIAIGYFIRISPDDRRRHRPQPATA